MINNYQNNISYLVGVALGDGNLSNPNGRAVRLRITCDNKYPNIIKNIVKTIKKILPLNKVSLVKRTKNCTDISCYSNQLENLLGWKALRGIGFTYSRTYKYFQKGKVRYNIRISKNVSELLSVIKAEKKNGKI